MVTFKKLFRAPYAVPNGLQVTTDGLWIADQISDRVALVEIAEPGDYGVTKLIREISSESSNTSGISFDGDALWMAANGAASLWRPPRERDAQPAMGELLRVDLATGATQERYPLPGGGGTHGVDCDPYEPGIIWLTTLKSQTLSKVRISDWQVLGTIELPHERGHGVVRVSDGIWVVHTADRTIVMLDVDTGDEITRIDVPTSEPEPHGLSMSGDDLLYCDATTGWIVQIILDP